MTDPAIAQYVIVARRRERSVIQIAHDLGMTKQQIYGIMRKAGIPVRPWIRADASQTKQERRRSVSEFWDRRRVNSRVKRATRAITTPEVRT
jgi:hypothetical protein